jgi:transcriptional regulator with XRE-family HTH domain
MEAKRKADALTLRQIAKKFGVGPSAVSDITRYVTWKDA